MNVLGIETTCDETACSVVKDGKTILSNVLSSQIESHTRYGGVYPELASRLHVDRCVPMIDLALKEANLSKSDIDLIGVSYTPGLIGAITIGLNSAKALSTALNIPYIGIHHIEAHLYAAMMSSKDTLNFPALGVVLSGGHTLLLKIHNIGSYEIISQTVDDAIGEAFDKVARMLNLPYPGGPEIEKLAKIGDPNAYDFKAGFVKTKPLHFSFSGLKTNVLYTISGPNAKKSQDNLPLQQKADIAASFQRAAFSDVVKKAFKAASTFDCKAIYLGGGVTQSAALKSMFDKENHLKIPLNFPEQGLSLDNGAMIAGLAYHKFLSQKTSDPLDLKAKPRTAIC